MLSGKYNSVSKNLLLISFTLLITNALSAQQDSVNVFLKGKSDPVKFYAAKVFENGLFNNEGEGLLFWVIDSLETDDSSLAFNLQKIVNGLELRKNNNFYKLDFTSVIYKQREKKKKGIDSLEEYRLETAVQRQIADSTNKARQDLADLYKQYIPERLYNNPELKKQVNAFIESASKINPELIYFQLMKFNTYVSSFVLYQSYAKYLIKIKDEFRIKRREWVYDILDRLNNQKYDKDFVNEAKELLDNFLNYSSPSFKIENLSFPVDSNLMNHFAALYYLKGNPKAVDTNLTLPEKRFFIEAKRRRDLLNLMSNIICQNKNDLIAELINNWYLFSGPNDSLKDIFAEQLINTIAQKYKTKNEFIFSIGKLDDIYPYNFFTKGPEPNKDLRIPLPYKSSSLFLASSYKYFIFDKISSFSYLKFRFSYSYVKATNEFPLINKGYDITPSISVLYEISEKGVLLNNSLKRFIFQIGTPLLIYKNILTIEPSFCLGKLFLSYQVTYPYKIFKLTQVGRNQWTKSEEAEGITQENKTCSHTVLGMGIELNLKIYEGFSISFSTITDQYQIFLNYGL